MHWATLPLKRYFEMSGRSRRKEFWLFMLLMVVVSILAGMIDSMLGMSRMIGGVYGPVTLVAALAFVIPQFSVSIRRLHDTERSGWWLLLFCVPVAVSVAMFRTGQWNYALANLVLLILLYFFVLDGTRGPNRYGSDPKEGEAPAAGAV
jgi:uncharacterized membrane protein YhaH (DUF805 family)